jgi:hypothetical protein
MGQVLPREGPDPTPDPGRGWRRLARVGAVMTALAIMMPMPGNDRESLFKLLITGWDLIAQAQRVLVQSADSITMPKLSEILSSMLGLICTLPFVTALVLSILCGCNRGLSKAKRMFRISLLITGVLLTAGAAYVFFALFFFRLQWLLWIPHVILFLAALAILDGWHRRESVLCEFWPGTFLVMSACVAWGLEGYLFVNFLAGFMGNAAIRWSWWNVLSAGALGSVMSAVGWLLWWRAVRRHLKLNL